MLPAGHCEGVARCLGIAGLAVQRCMQELRSSELHAIFQPPSAAYAYVVCAEDAAEPAWVDDGTLPTDAAGNLPFYLIDAHEEQNMPGTVFLLGKVPPSLVTVEHRQC